MSGTVLILGASGRFGRHLGGAFRDAGWRVRAFDRQTDDLDKAARGVDVIANGWNPAYPDWARTVPALTEQIIAAAKGSGATVLIPGNIYGYGAAAPPALRADTPKSANNPLGRIRNEMEAAYRNAKVKTIVLRAGDYLDTCASGNWFDQIITAKAAKGRIAAPGDPTVPHSWAYLPDFARATVLLAEKRDELESFTEVLFPGYTLSLNEIGALVTKATGRPQTVRRMNWLPLRIAAPFWAMARCLIEMRYLWSMPHRLDGTRFRQILPDFSETDPLVAIASAVAHLEIDPDQPVARGNTHIFAE